MSLLRDYLNNVRQQLTQHRHRLGVVLAGEATWKASCLDEVISLFRGAPIFQLGGHPLAAVTKYVSGKQGRQLLGQECSLLICDFCQEFDANSFSAALGTLSGGGMLVILSRELALENQARLWMQRALDELLVLTPTTPLQVEIKPLPEFVSNADFAQQYQAIENIIHVATGHRKRPLVLTADRGRGKSSALGLAAAKLMRNKSLHIVVTAPSRSAVDPVFFHASQHLGVSEHCGNQLIFAQSKLEFIAPDELLTLRSPCDLLFIDEAAAIPISMLQKLVAFHHRIVFSTTVHGYEGCGRGFTLKFMPWLKSERRESRHFHIDQPIRWSIGDPLEAWHYRTFLLDAQLSATPAIECCDIHVSQIQRSELVDSPELMGQLFSLLIQAHYQTTPNDLLMLLSDQALTIHVAYCLETMVGCAISLQEGGLDSAVVQDIQLGKVRPKGHLGATSLANHLGMTEAATQVSQRIMRIAVHPDCQGRGVGTKLIDHLSLEHHCSFVSTSFGVTEQLLHFWLQNGFTPLRLGSQRDQASGCHSVIMVKPIHQLLWLEAAVNRYRVQIQYSLANTFSQLEAGIVRSLLATHHASGVCNGESQIIQNYINGGASFDSAAPFIYHYLLSHPQRLENVSDLVIRKVMQHWSWSECAREYQLAGKRAVETSLREDLPFFTDSEFTV